MLSENLTKLRRAKGLSQEEVAGRLHVARQTVSKWERGLSVPDADLLIRIGELFETPVSSLLGDLAAAEEKNAVAEKLGQLNHLLAERNRRSRRIWKTVMWVLIGIGAATLLFMALSVSAYSSYSARETQTHVVEVQAGE